MVGIHHHSQGGKGVAGKLLGPKSDDCDAEASILHNINEELKALYNYLEKHEVGWRNMYSLNEIFS